MDIETTIKVLEEVSDYIKENYAPYNYQEDIDEAVEAIKIRISRETGGRERLWKSVKHANIQHGTNLQANMSAGMQISVKQKNVMPHTKN